MGIIFTSNDLIRYLYHETDEKENKQISYSINKNSELRQEYDAMKQTRRFLDKLMISPNEELTNSILFRQRN